VSLFFSGTFDLSDVENGEVVEEVPFCGPVVVEDGEARASLEERCGVEVQQGCLEVIQD